MTVPLDKVQSLVQSISTPNGTTQEDPMNPTFSDTVRFNAQRALASAGDVDLNRMFSDQWNDLADELDAEEDQA